MHTIQLDDIEPATLFDSSSWALLYRPLIFPAPGKKQSEHIYAKVLPFFNRRPLMCSVGSTGAGGDRAEHRHPLAAVSRGGDASGARLALEAARACVAAAATTEPKETPFAIRM